MQCSKSIVGHCNDCLYWIKKSAQSRWNYYSSTSDSLVTILFIMVVLSCEESASLSNEYKCGVQYDKIVWFKFRLCKGPFNECCSMRRGRIVGQIKQLAIAYRGLLQLGVKQEKICLSQNLSKDLWHSCLQTKMMRMIT